VSGTAGEGAEGPTNEQPTAQAVKPRKFFSPADLARFLGALELGRGVPTSGATQEIGTAEKAGDSHKARRKAKRERRSGKKEG
jgi:hypothetical protein